jgi:hypothetical protein
MSDELERLREVARAAAAMIQADDESTAAIRGWRERTDPPPVDDLKAFHRLSGLYSSRRTELVAALARLAELNPLAG